MPKVPNPFFSFRARGKLNDSITARARRTDTVIEKTPHPKDARSPAQLAHRVMFQACIDLWHLLSPAEQATWESVARPHHMTGYAFYLSQCLRPNPGIYLPLAGGTMQGNIDMDSNTIENLPDPTTNQQAATKAYADAHGGAADYPMSLKPAITRYVIPGWYVHTFTAQLLLAGRIYYTPIFVTQTTTYDRIAINVSVLAVGTADLRIFNWTAGLPSSLLLSAGNVDTGSIGLKEIAISQQLTRGYYFLAVRCTGAPSLQCPSNAYAISPPVPGICPSSNPYPTWLTPVVDAAYADPAPAPTAMMDVARTFVFMREA